MYHLRSHQKEQGGTAFPEANLTIWRWSGYGLFAGRCLKGPGMSLAGRIENISYAEIMDSGLSVRSGRERGAVEVGCACSTRWLHSLHQKLQTTTWKNPIPATPTSPAPANSARSTAVTDPEKLMLHPAAESLPYCYNACYCHAGLRRRDLRSCPPTQGRA
jgi:hypothetical protein